MEQMSILETEKAKMAEKYKLELMSTKQKLQQTQQEMFAAHKSVTQQPALLLGSFESGFEFRGPSHKFASVSGCQAASRSAESTRVTGRPCQSQAGALNSRKPPASATTSRSHWAPL